MRFVLINEGTAASALTAQVTPAWLARCAAACQIQLNRDVASEWGGSFVVRAGANAGDIGAGEIVFSLVDSLPEAPGAIAYHDVEGHDVPVAFLALSTCNTLDDVSTAVSHEFCETWGDASCDLWADDGAGNEWALELCDAVESASYPIDLGEGQPPIAVSDFLLRSFFGPGAVAPYSFKETAAAPFKTASGGYQIKRSSGTGETQVQAMEGSKRGARVASRLHHWSSRPARRGHKPVGQPECGEAAAHE